MTHEPQELRMIGQLRGTSLQDAYREMLAEAERDAPSFPPARIMAARIRARLSVMTASTWPFLADLAEAAAAAHAGGMTEDEFHQRLNGAIEELKVLDAWPWQRRAQSQPEPLEASLADPWTQAARPDPTPTD